MISKLRGHFQRQLSTSKLCLHGLPGGIPGNNLPWRKGMESPMRFTIFWLVIGVLGFGAPWLVVRHQMLRNVTYDDPPPEDEQPS